jgi:RNA polymerase sigma-70 factor (ECF subfamily)
VAYTFGLQPVRDQDQAKPAVDANAALVAALESHDDGAEEELIRRFRPGLVAMMRARTRDAEVAPELAHDTLLAVIASIRQRKLREPERLAGFVHGIAKNVLAAHYRRRASEPRTVALEADAVARPADTDEGERWQLALRALAALPAADREVLEMSLVQCLAPQEIAARLGLTADTVRMRKMRAVRRAAELVQQWLRRPASERQYG